jgi:hypothetical protein
MPHATRFVQERQQETNWCWAAVAVSVAECNGSTQRWTQCTLAAAEFTRPCCLDPDRCNEPHSLAQSLTRTQNLQDNGHKTTTLRIDTIDKELRKGRPIPIRILRNDGTAHFMVISGYDLLADGRQLLTIQDPWFGRNQIRYDDLLRTNTYRGGRWSDSYLTEPA